MQNTKTDIFISYRRSDGRDIARTVQLALKSANVGNVFFDYNSLRDGIFNEKIFDAIDQCSTFILVLSPESMTRCAVEGDWVASEIRRAYKAGCNVIPLAIDSNFDAWPANLPSELNFLKSIQQTKLLTDEYFDDSVARLIQRIKLAKKEPKRPLETSQSTTYSSFWPNDRLMTALELDNDAVRLIPKNDYVNIVSLFQRAAEMGCGPSMGKLGLIYELGKFGQEQNFEKAHHWYSLACQADYSGGWLAMAGMYREGKYVEKSESSSEACRELAIEYRDKCQIKVTRESNRLSFNASPEFRWFIMTDNIIVLRGSGNKANTSLLKPGCKYFICGYDGKTYRQGDFRL